MTRLSWSAAALCMFASSAHAQSSFVNFETPHVHPLDLTPDRTRLLAVNTPDNRLEVFDVVGSNIQLAGSVPVGLDPVSVRARSNGEAWVVNQISDSVSVVDLNAMHVVRTFQVLDEPADVVFAGSPERAFISCSQVNKLVVKDPAGIAADVIVDIRGEEPRALATSVDRSQVFVAIFESGNATTIVNGGNNFVANAVSSNKSPYFNSSNNSSPNPPPNNGSSFAPPIGPALPPPPRSGVIVRKTTGGQWLDDNAHDWSNVVSGVDASASGRIQGWNMPDRDLAIVDANNPTTAGTTYASGIMNINMAIGVNPVLGYVSVVGTDAINERRFEPNLNGIFVRVKTGMVNPASAQTLGTVDLNGYIDYQSQAFYTQQWQKDIAIGDPRGIAWTANGQHAYVTGMGSNNVIKIDLGGQRVGLPIVVGEGPTGIVLNDAADRAYVLNKFSSSVSVIVLSTGTVAATHAIYDPSPAAIKVGRKHLYDTHLTSGFGQASCASCHVDARLDRLAWDLGNPAGSIDKPDDQNLGSGNPGLATGYNAFHPMKGPMSTQTLQDIIGKEPHHWRGDRDGLEAFSPAFTHLLGDSAQPSPAAMQEFEDFLATIHFPPNPHRNLDNTLPTGLALDGHFTNGKFSPEGAPLPAGNAQSGHSDYQPPLTLDGGFACINCHTFPTGVGPDQMWTGAGFASIPLGPHGESHASFFAGDLAGDATFNKNFKIPHLRNLPDKVGFNLTKLESAAGFGFLHDGSVDSLSRFFFGFEFASDQQLADQIALMLAYSGSELSGSDGSSLGRPPGPASRDAHAAVGKQVTFTLPFAQAPPADQARLTQLWLLADQGKIGLTGRGRVNGQLIGMTYVGANYWLLHTGDLVDGALLGLVSGPGSEFTYTAVQKGSEHRIGIDRDGDGCLDGYEVVQGTNPSDPLDCLCSAPLPAAPTALGATANGLYGVDLAWTDASSNETGFVLERSLNSGPYLGVTTLPANTTTYRDGGLTDGQNYSYRLTARNCAGASAPVLASAATPAKAALPDMRVAAITMIKDCTNPTRAIAYVAITPATGQQPLPGVVVEGRFSGATNEDHLFATTAGPAGGYLAVFVSSPVAGGGTWTFTVTGVTEMLHNYDPNQNMVTSATLTATCP